MKKAKAKKAAKLGKKPKKAKKATSDSDSASSGSDDSSEDTSSGSEVGVIPAKNQSKGTAAKLLSQPQEGALSPISMVLKNYEKVLNTC